MEIKDSKLKWVYLTGFFLILSLPLWNLPPWFSPPDWGKTITFRIIFSILIFLFIYQLLFEKPDTTFCTTIRNAFSKNNKSYFAFRLLIALLGIYFLATIFSLDLHFSLWGNPYRAEGFIVFAFQILFAILLFLLLQKKDWQKILDFSIFIGILVALIAVFQQFGLISSFLIHKTWRPPSTVGGSSFLAIYLSLLGFLALSFGILRREIKKKIFYLSAFLLFLFVIIFLAKTRAVYVGLAVGLLWFLFFYPKKLTLFKISAGLLLVLAILGFYFLKTHPEISLFEEKSLPQTTIDRILNIQLTTDQARVSAWKVSLQAIRNRPILGYGPENFYVGFNKYYDPSLPGIQKPPAYYYPQASWWDRAHNFIFDIGVTAGLPTLIIYLSLFGILFWQLQKLKKKRTEQFLIAHGIQAAFLTYLVAKLASFDTFSTYQISFLFMAYSLYLINSDANPAPEPRRNTSYLRGRQVRYGIMFVLLIGLIWFIWGFNIKPLQVNKEINLALYESEHNYCERALARMEKVLSIHTNIDNYLRLQYSTVIKNCANEKSINKTTDELAQKATEMLRENIKIRPYYARNWILLGSYLNILIEKEIQAGKEIQSESIQNLKKETNNVFERAHQLSPKRQEVFTQWIRTNLLTGDYSAAEERSQKCIDANETVRECWWLMGLTQAYLKNYEESEYYIEMAQERGYNPQSENSLLELTKAYIVTENYSGLVETYSGLISINPRNPQYHASLAVAYQKLGEIEKAKKEALKVLELAPELRKEVEEFLKALE